MDYANLKAVPACVLGTQLGYVIYERRIKVKSQGNCSNTPYSCCLHPHFVLETILTSVNSKTCERLKYTMVQ